MRELLTSTLVLICGLLSVSAWILALNHDLKRGEPLLAVAWVVCPPCGVLRGGYVYFVN
jgi:hypothetical protein